MSYIRDLTGQRFGRLVAVECVRGKREAQWRCVCDCGNDTSVHSRSNLVNGVATSCGCYGRERKSEANRTHGCTGTRLYRIWKAMHTRCLNPNSPAFKYYGGRGICICEEWRKDFAPFKEWAESNGYLDDLTIDRIDTNGDYSPSNCRWITMKEQNENKRAKNGFRVKEDE